MDFTKGILSVLNCTTVKKMATHQRMLQAACMLTNCGLAMTSSEKKRPAVKQVFLKASIGIEPMHRGFADLSLTTWV